MAYDERLAERIREALADEKAVDEIKMMGGLCFMVSGHMAVGIVGDDLMVRIGPEAYDRALEESTRPRDGFHRTADERVRLRCPGRHHDETCAAVVDRSRRRLRGAPAPEACEVPRRAKRDRLRVRTSPGGLKPARGCASADRGPYGSLDASRSRAPVERSWRSPEGCTAVPQGHPRRTAGASSQVYVVSIGNGPSAVRITSRSPGTSSRTS